MGDVLDIVALRSLTSIADAGGFRRAAETLHLSQSAVSQHVRRLEQACGCVLVERDGRGMRFTADGEVLISEARKILAVHDGALEQLRNGMRHASSLTIGSTEHAADLLLPVITERLNTAFPQHTVRFRIDRGRQLNDRLDEGAIDASLLIGEARGDNVSAAGSLPLTWYAAKGWTPSTAPGSVPLVVIDGPCTIRRRALSALADHNIESSIVCEAGHLAGVVNAVRAGVGVALLAHFGAPPAGLEERYDLPPVAPERLHVRGRDGAPAALISTVAAAARDLLRVPTAV